MNGNWRAMGSFSLNTPFKNRNWIFRTYSYLQYRNQNGYTTLNKEEPVKTSVQHLTGRERLRITYRTRQMELTGLVGLIYNNSYNDVRRNVLKLLIIRQELNCSFIFPGGWSYIMT